MYIDIETLWRTNPCTLKPMKLNKEGLMPMAKNPITCGGFDIDANTLRVVTKQGG